MILARFGTPRVYQGSFKDLQVDSKVCKDFHYIIMGDEDERFQGHWVFYDKDIDAFRDGGVYGSLSIPPTSMRYLQKCFRTSSENVLSFSLPSGFTKDNLVFVFIDGMKLPQDEYSIVGSRVVLNKALNVIDTCVELVVFCDTKGGIT